MVFSLDPQQSSHAWIVIIPPSITHVTARVMFETPNQMCNGTMLQTLQWLPSLSEPNANAFLRPGGLTLYGPYRSLLYSLLPHLPFTSLWLCLCNSCTNLVSPHPDWPFAVSLFHALAPAVGTTYLLTLFRVPPHCLFLWVAISYPLI